MSASEGASTLQEKCQGHQERAIWIERKERILGDADVSGRKLAGLYSGSVNL
jgi:hypothetical protein